MPTLARYWRRSLPLATCLSIAVIELAFVQLSLTPGLNLWADAVTGLSSASLYGGAVAAGVSAFEGGQWAAANRARLAASSRSPIRDRLRQFGLAATPILGGYLLAVAVRAVI